MKMKLEAKSYDCKFIALLVRRYNLASIWFSFGLVGMVELDSCFQNPSSNKAF